MKLNSIILILTGLLLSNADWAQNPASGPAANKDAEQLMARARTEFNQGKTKEAIELATKAIEKDPKTAQCYYFRGRLYEVSGQAEKAIPDFTEVLKIEPKSVDVYQIRGCEHFKAGMVTNSVADFLTYLEARPLQKPHHWQLGISYYYANQ